MAYKKHENILLHVKREDTSFDKNTIEFIYINDNLCQNSRKFIPSFICTNILVLFLEK